MSLYYYNLKGGKRIEWNTAGWFECPEVEALRESGARFPNEKHDQIQTGKNHVTYSPAKQTTEVNGDIVITSTRKLQKARKGRTDLYCRCGKQLVFKGYPVWIDRIKSETKIPGLGTAVDSKRLLKRCFKTKKAQMAFIEKTRLDSKA